MYKFFFYFLCTVVLLAIRCFRPHSVPRAIFIVILWIYTHILFGMPAGGGAMGGGYLHTIVTTSSPSNSSDGWNLITMLLVNTLCGSCMGNTIFNGSVRRKSHKIIRFFFYYFHYLFIVLSGYYYGFFHCTCFVPHPLSGKSILAVLLPLPVTVHALLRSKSAYTRPLNRSLNLSSTCGTTE